MTVVKAEVDGYLDGYMVVSIVYARQGVPF